MVSSNNAINNTIGASISGVTNTLTVTNSSNTASSAARETITVGGGTAGDPTLNWSVSGVTNWEMGIDNSDSDKWKLSLGTSLGTADTITSFTTGEVLKPRTPCVVAHKSTVSTNVTGDGTGYTVIFDTVSIDQGSNYNNATGIFTAPVTGTYLITAQVAYNGLTAAHTGAFLLISTSPKVVWNPSYNPYATQNLFTTQQAVNNSAIIRLTSGDTVRIIFAVYNGAKVVGVTGSNIFNEYPNLGITLLC